VISSSVFMHIAARFWLEDVEFKRAVATVIALFAVGGVLFVVQFPVILSLLVLVSIGIITVQTIYQTDMKKAVLILAVYMIVSLIIGTVANAVFQLVGRI
ncbi:MAG: hypothetical protein SXQ77_10700, partial [Halobacteria archaeon]|nr:hypothetical protein [Halobacteria archaeon]